MIATPDPVPAAAPQPRQPRQRVPLSPGAVITRLMIAVAGLLFLAGGAAGYNRARGAASMALADWIVAGLAASALVALLWLAIDTWSRRDKYDGPVPPRERFSNRVLVGSVLAGMVVGVGVQFDQLSVMLTAATLPVWLAGAAVVMIVIAGPAVTIWWLRGIDEHERDAYVAGGNVAAHVMLFGIPAWWIASRTGLVMFRPDIVLALACIIWSIVWLRSKYG